MSAAEVVAARSFAAASGGSVAESRPALLVPLFHLLLEGLACVEPWARGEAAPRCAPSASRAASLLRGALAHPPRGPGAGLDARAALRLAQTFALRDADLEALDATAVPDARRYAATLFRNGAHSPAVLFALQMRAQPPEPLLIPPPDTERACEPLLMPAVSLGDGDDVAGVAAFPALLAARQDALAESLAAALGGSAPAALVRAALAAQAYRAAAFAASRFGLEAAFPQAAALHARAQMRRLAAPGLWDAAAALAGADVALRRELVALAAEWQEPAIALDLARRFGLEGELDAEALDAAAAAAAQRDAAIYLPLALPPDRVHWVDDVAALPRLRAALAGADVIGLDAEWRADVRRRRRNARAPHGARRLPPAEELAAASAAPPEPLTAATDDDDEDDDEDLLDEVDDPNISGAKPARVALLQLATRDDAFLLDLPALAAADSDALSWALQPLCSDDANPDSASTPPLVVGFGVVADVRRAASSAPRCAALRRLAGPRVVDLRDVWRSARGGEPPPGGLAGAAAAALGRPLDKRPRMSDWERRPLSATQRLYAANDAHAAVRIYVALQEGRTPRRDDDDGDGGMLQPNAASSDAAPASFEDESLPPLGPAHVAAALAARGDEGVTGWHMVRSSEPGASSAAAAAALGVPLDRVIKALAAVGSAAQLVLLLLGGGARCDLRAAATAAGLLGRRALRLATAEECVRCFGYPPGSMPPLGLRAPCRVLIDDALFAADEAAHPLVFAGGGSPEWHAAMPLPVLARAANAQPAPLSASHRSIPEPAVPLSTASDGVAFVVDGALSRLGRWLRCLGADVAAPPATLTGSHAAALAAALAPRPGMPRRVLLTSNAALASRHELAGTPAFLLPPGASPRQQLAAVRSRFGLAFDPARLLSRCAACNGPVGTRLPPEAVAADERLPRVVRQAAEETQVWACNDCAKPFWVGPLSRRAVEFIASLTADLDHDATSAALGGDDSQLAAQIRDVMAAAARAAADDASGADEPALA